MTFEVQTKEGKFVIETNGLWRRYKPGSKQEVAALRGVDLRIDYGRFVALKGRSGSGKTSLLNCIGGLDQPTSGVVRVFGRNLANLSDKQLTDWRRDRLGFVFQSFSLLPTFSAYENVELMLRIAGKSGLERERRTRYCLGIVGLDKWKDHRPDEMSGGQQQRVAIARALANYPKLLLADEPTGELDTKTAKEILALFQRLVAEEKVTLVMATHDNLVQDYADKVLELKDGKITH
ncbi:MAG: ABC transporter ATP-binding protein [Anaerolineales bacterium]